MKTLFPARLCAVVLLGAVVGACTSSGKTTESTGQYLDDTAISTKVRAAIIGDKSLHITDISVETFKSTVQLSGFVSSTDTKRHAGEVAAGVAGVKAVENNLIVK